MKRYSILILLLLLALPFAALAGNQSEIAKLQARTEKYVKKVQAQPDWLYSRLQMYWQSHATDVYVMGEKFDHPGGSCAPEPTVKFAGTRGTESQYNRPALDDIIPYDDDAQGDVTFISRATGKMEKAHPSKTGCNIQGVNRQIMSIARDAAKVYAATGDKAYGNMAAKVFDVYMKGIYYRNVPIDLNHGHQQTLVGMTTFEVIHEDIINELTQLYPLVKPLVKDDQPVIDAAFKKWAENIIANGVPHNNWDLFQADFIMKIALVLNDDASYEDGKGKQYYLDYICHKNSIRQWSMDKLIDFGFDKQSKTWYEAPGYSLTVLNTFADFANRLDRDGGIDLFKQHPILIDAWKVVPQYLFPNMMFVGFGDSHPNYVDTKGLDDIVAYAKRHKNRRLAKEMEELGAALKNKEERIKNTALMSSRSVSAACGGERRSGSAPAACSVTTSNPVVGNHNPQSSILNSQLFFAPNVSWLALRTGMDQQHDLMASLNASLGNHQHANGISLELYGKGYVLGPDAGIGKYLYSGLDYSEYYSQMPAHNTVVVDGISSYPVMMSNHKFNIVDTCSYDSMTYATVDFIEPETQATQQRTTAVVRTSNTGGFYIDVFRSHKQDGTDKTHDYFYHNLGQTMTVTDFDDKPLDMHPTDELAFAGGHLYAYSYIYNKESITTTKGVKATFKTKIESEKVTQAMDGQHEITMTMWMAPAKDRTIFKALSPVNMEYERMPDQPYNIGKQPVLTFVARQHGEAWHRPFVCVYEPSSDTEPGDIAKVGFFTPGEDDAVGIHVRLKNNDLLTFVCHADGKVTKQ